MSDIKQFKHGEEGTHYACEEMIEKLGDKVGCCECNNHDCKYGHDAAILEDVPEKNGCTCPCHEIKPHACMMCKCPGPDEPQSEEETYRCSDKCPWHKCPNNPKSVETHGYSKSCCKEESIRIYRNRPRPNGVECRIVTNGL
jgi:hypothetical protein